VNDILARIYTELVGARTTPYAGHLNTGDVRKISAAVFRSLEDKSKEYVFSLCTKLLEEMRRAAAVVLIPSIKRGKYAETKPLRTADLLMQDEHDLVRKGYGWMLKVLSVKEPELVIDYLTKHKAVMPRVAFRYALEKLSEDQRRVLME
jgi:3-methyladenine DNA glycosylase AlkD